MDTYFNVRLDDGTLVVVFADTAAEAVALAQALVAPRQLAEGESSQALSAGTSTSAMKRKRKPQK